MAVSKRLRYEVLRRDNHTCRYCGRAAPEVRLTIDHVMPVALGGRDEAGNLVTACSDCNSGKTSTTPDAHVVDQVADDAVRWAAAVRLAGDDMLRDLTARGHVRNAFLHAWRARTVGGELAPLPPEWQASLDQFTRAGLPDDLLIDCIAVAMSNKRIPAEAKFRYMCGVAWARVRELHDRAGSGRAVPQAGSAPQRATDRLAIELYGLLPWGESPSERVELLAEFNAAHVDDEEFDGTPISYDHWSDDDKVVFAAVSRLVDSYFSTVHEMMLGELRPEVRSDLLRKSRESFLEHGLPDASDEEVARYAAMLIVSLLPPSVLKASGPGGRS